DIIPDLERLDLGIEVVPLVPELGGHAVSFRGAGENPSPPNPLSHKGERGNGYAVRSSWSPPRPLWERRPGGEGPSAFLPLRRERLLAQGQHFERQAADQRGRTAELLVEPAAGDRADLRAEQGGRGVPLDDLDGALVERDGPGAAHDVLRLGDEGVQRAAQRVEPLAVVDHRGPGLFDQLLELELLFGQHGALDVAVDGQDDLRTRRFIDLAGLQIHDAVFEDVDLPNTVDAADLVQRRGEVRQRHRGAVERDGQAVLEGEGDRGRRVGRL